MLSVQIDSQRFPDPLWFDMSRAAWEDPSENGIHSFQATDGYIQMLPTVLQQH